MIKSASVRKNMIEKHRYHMFIDASSKQFYGPTVVGMQAFSKEKFIDFVCCLCESLSADICSYPNMTGDRIVFKTDDAQYGIDFFNNEVILYADCSEEIEQQLLEDDIETLTQIWEELVSEIQEAFDHFISLYPGVFYTIKKDGTVLTYDEGDSYVNVNG